MIGETTVLWIGTVALVTTLVGMGVSVRQYESQNSSLTGLITFGFSLLFWILFTLHSTGYARTLGDGSITTVSTPSFMAVGLIGTALTIVLLFDGALRAIRAS